MQWAAIDFETASRDRASACSVGVVLFDDGHEVDARDWLIRPPANYYDRWNVAIHGIFPEQTDDAPGFAAVWAEVEEMIAGRTLLAHNAAFDMGVLSGASALTGAPVGDHRYACTVALARNAWPGIASYRLPAVCEHLGIELENHHDALADARACGEIACAAAADHGPGFVMRGAQSFGRLTEREMVRASRRHTRRPVAAAAVATGSAARRPGAPAVGSGYRGPPSYIQSSGPLPQPDEAADDGHPLFGRSIVFTGDYTKWTRKQAAELAAACGAHCKSAVSSKTDYLVVGKQDPGFVKADGLSGKMRKALELIASGVRIEILSEQEFAALL